MASPSISVAQLYNGILAGDRAALSRAITQAESTREPDRRKSEQLLKKLLPKTGNSVRIGITGAPGVGKSTFIEVLGEHLVAQGKKICVLTIDPTSRLTKGSILGDKTRMQQLSKYPEVFIRPSPSALALGGVSINTREAMLLCEAAGFDVILIETVGVGQSETDVRNMVDFFLLLVLPGAGDELQGIKKGIMEMADGVVITKADGDSIKAAKQAQADASMAVHLRSESSSDPIAIGWKTKVMAVSAVEKKGIDEVWKMISDYVIQAHSSGYFKKNRANQKMQWLESSTENLFRELMRNGSVAKKKEQLLKKVMKDQLLPSEAARELWKGLRKK